MAVAAEPYLINKFDKNNSNLSNDLRVGLYRTKNVFNKLIF